MKRVVFFAVMMGLSGLSIAEGRDINAIYEKSCKICHAAPVPGAPKAGDPAAWEPRLKKGMDALVASVTNGMGAMPPKGMCFDCSAEEYKALIELMAK